MGIDKLSTSIIIDEEIENMYRVSIELYKHEWKFGRTINLCCFSWTHINERFSNFATEV